MVRASSLNPALLLQFHYNRHGHVFLVFVFCFFCKGQNTKYFRLYVPYCLCHSYEAQPLQCKSSCKQYVNEWTWLCSNNTFLTKAGGGPDLTHGPVCWLPAVWSSPRSSCAPALVSPHRVLSMWFLPEALGGLLCKRISYGWFWFFQILWYRLVLSSHCHHWLF